MADLFEQTNFHVSRTYKMYEE